MIIKVRNRCGELFTNDSGADNEKSIVSIHFGTSYTQVEVQREHTDELTGEVSFPIETIIIPTEGQDNLAKAIDFMAVSDEEIGEWA